MSKVAFFSNQFARKNGTGVARYAHSLLAGFAELETPPHVIPVATWSNREADDLRVLKASTGLRLLPTGRWLTPLLWMTAGLPKIEQLLDFRADLVHVNDLGYLVATSKPYAVTIHDLGSLTHPEYFRNNSQWITQQCLELAIKKTAAFICVSQATADSLKEYVRARYRVDLSSRTHVVHEGVSQIFFQEPDPALLSQNHPFDFLHQPFILAVGKISPRKNLEVVIRMLKKLQSTIPHHLVTVGGDGWDFEEVKNLVHTLGLADRVHFLGYVSDEQICALYGQASLFIYPSLFEGFGLTILEAMASGCPVITSNLSSLPEVAGDAAILVDPQRIDELAAATEAVCHDQVLAAELKRKGRARVKLFSWKKCAAETLAIYQSLLARDEELQAAIDGDL